MYISSESDVANYGATAAGWSVPGWVYVDEGS